MRLIFLMIYILTLSACGSSHGNKKHKPKPDKESVLKQTEKKEREKDGSNNGSQTKEQSAELKTVIYHCAFPVNAYSDEINAYKNTPCAYDYSPEPGEAMPTISILKKYAPASPLYNEAVLQKDDFELDYGNAQIHRLTTKFSKPPFGSLTSCHTAKVDVKIGANSSTQKVRLTFKRHDKEDGEFIWVPQNPETWPRVEQIGAFYKQSGDEKVDLYLMCEWIPRPEDIKNGEVIDL